MDTATVIGSIAAIASTASFAPQAIKAVRTRDLSGISARGYVVTVAAFMLWLAYGLMLKQWPLIASNAVCLALSAFILAMKLLPQRKRDEVADAVDPTS